MPNIQFNYLYRDAANYKKFGFQIFQNPDHISQEMLEGLIKTKLIDGEYFYANDWQISDLYLIPGIVKQITPFMSLNLLNTQTNRRIHYLT
ncbi:hypothetical protein SAMN04487890_10784 [Mucilaginibacter polytrichastri]|nr:hypothetical protein SAMN04487890_10784 [Mucilaginibacter polytrichastri]